MDFVHDQLLDGRQFSVLVNTGKNCTLSPGRIAHSGRRMSPAVVRPPGGEGGVSMVQVVARASGRRELAGKCAVLPHAVAVAADVDD